MSRKRQPLVSVIVTAYNSDRYLDGCLASIAASSYQNLQIVLVDDGSIDGTAAIINQWADRDHRVCAEHLDHVGRRAALVHAHSMAVGELLCWVDADDVVASRAIEACAQRIDATHELVYTHRELIDELGRSRGPHVKNRVVYRPVQLLVDNMIFHLRMFTASLFERAGGVGDLESAIDWDMNLRMTEHTAAAAIPRVLYQYRVHGNRMSASQAQVLCGQIAVRRAIDRRGLRLDLVVDHSGWHVTRR